LPGKVNIEVMIDTNANSRVLDDQFRGLRDELDDGVSDTSRDDATRGGDKVTRALKEFRSYLQKVKRVTGVDYEVTQRDTAQIFHEKTNTFTPELAKKAGIPIKPDFLRENLESGLYHVEPPIHGEEVYYAALRKMVYMIQEDKEPGLLKREGISKPDDIGDERLQGLFREHMMQLPVTSKYRQEKPFKAEFERYHEVRFNQGEETAITFLKNHPLPPEGERTAFVFVGKDNYANESMATARKGQEKQDDGKLDTFVTNPRQFTQMLRAVIRSIEQEYPQTRNLRSSLRELAPEPRSFRSAERPDAEVERFASVVAGAQKSHGSQVGR